ncbi:uncharacterized protein FFUJ_04300 [Fusarium fujikuroi IMI 58289]|uniref:Uncharacterized protein n=2 Tax=Fusarium fujikuroi TaxID=5127 RepID=S0DPV3_GIBF5|nr:uncharacterized protein FFUJ_04300 [Fusarium fujikuroi IMI 58289]SCN73671.1 uncharacterized protein FFE2_02907 [Fusarium fujikuroi]CCT64475.1 uncharacterized protein FFUJ_04300 [Fusarium fujikuroi IMI 58289]SCN88339.1 uncharacterized protein FFM5_04362 [Fusarium fujikuroi]SCO37017.1 uncharacterized protein FFMR_04495 [Fusarium fujikuroi]SCO54852.1 uncharacterized protein FFNC_15676 [Fusarium fujikuroi]
MENMMIDKSDDYGVMEILIYNAKDADLYAFVIRPMKICERLEALAGTSRSTMWDAIAGNLGVMTNCITTSVRISANTMLHMRTVSGSDESLFDDTLILNQSPGATRRHRHQREFLARLHHVESGDLHRQGHLIPDLAGDIREIRVPEV